MAGMCRGCEAFCHHQCSADNSVYSVTIPGGRRTRRQDPGSWSHTGTCTHVWRGQSASRLSESWCSAPRTQQLGSYPANTVSTQGSAGDFLACKNQVKWPQIASKCRGTPIHRCVWLVDALPCEPRYLFCWPGLCTALQLRE